MDARLPAHVEVSGLIRAVESAGGFAMVLQKGERDAGTILVLTTQNGRNTRLWERMPQLDGSRKFSCTREQDDENPREIDEYVGKRRRSDPDCWVIELDIENAERFVAPGPG
ncbi:DUF1491 family protein [Qipengyuania citrea]|jgi:hypothetical protein|uniref:DUF1491 family protein n=1 Tax=Qipengyuania TaxID=1855416 RepID=UPI000E97F6A5|nr:DUF1491 family protein [Qipengyuania citrea]MCZ4264157.1 DUF1491 family protein [Erythrobacter sp. G21629-S1]HAN88375.1 DUF1491 domain-containing protein [Erythrobacter sp.]MCD1589364.1 DUF1491 family protein [Qipengyuania citrea]HBM04189.1 DUF1491 domain-containing protein [Erythrobacter sp.]HBM71897.1 DUF1491 domain-containing protein [Erythrobacter sp.]|tara:strand:+ start:2537 stop:2872 length:336 start_codon:yes stop_codon:yes gene_type:complete